MANVIKTIDQSLPRAQQYAVFSNTDAATGDVIRVATTLGRPADTITIDTSASSDLVVRFNSKVTVFPKRNYPENEKFGWASEQNLTQGVELDTGSHSITIGGATAASYSRNDLAISDIVVTYTTGTWTITVS